MNKKRKKFTTKYVYLLVVLIVIAIALLSYVIKSDKKLNVFESIIKDAFVVVQKIVYFPIKGIKTTIC